MHLASVGAPVRQLYILLQEPASSHLSLCPLQYGMPMQTCYASRKERAHIAGTTPNPPSLTSPYHPHDSGVLRCPCVVLGRLLLPT